MSITDHLRKRGAGYITAIVAVIVAWLVRALIDPLAGDTLPFGTFFLAVLAASWYGGTRSGLLAIVLSLLIADFFFVQPRYSQTWIKTISHLDSVRFFVVCMFLSFSCGKLRSWKKQIRQQRENLKSEMAGRRRIEDEVRRQRDLLHVTLAGIGDAVITTDALGRVTFLNPVAETLTGWLTADAIDQPLESVFRIVNEQTRSPLESTVRKVIREGRTVGLSSHTILIARDKSEFSIDDSASPIRDGQGNVVGVVLIIRDVTQRRKNEASVRRQAERQRLLWEAAAVLLTTDEPDAMMRGLFAKLAPHFNLDSYLNFMVNDAGDALRLESCMGIPDQAVHSIQRLEFGQSVCGFVAQQRQPVVADHIQQSDDPKVQMMKSLGIRVCVCNPLLTGDKLQGTLSFASRQRDTFEPDELEFLRTISHYVTVAHERLRLIAALRDGDRRKDEFLATLAHELRNPLAPIRNALQVMSLTANDPESVEQTRSVMERQVGQMVHLIDDLLDVSRISRGKLELRKETVDLQSIVASAVETCRPYVEQSEHRLTVTLPPNPLFVEGDKTRLAQVISNLLNNAAKFTPTGGQIWLSAELDGKDVVLSVKDTGIGVTPDVLPCLFEMFMQADRSLEKTHGGLGIGLNLAKRLVEMHGGSITAESEGVDKGCSFTIRLPALVLAKPRAPIVETRNDQQIQNRLKILVADDNRDAANTLAAMLRITGHEVRTAHDGQEAVDAAAAYRPDVALLDIGMPRMNGYDAARQIRERLNSIMLIALTGWGQEDDKQRSYEAGFDHHLTKPADPATLNRLLVGWKPSGTTTREFSL